VSNISHKHYTESAIAGIQLDELHAVVYTP